MTHEPEKAPPLADTAKKLADAYAATAIYALRIRKAIAYLSQQIDGDSPALDQTLSEAIRILEGAQS